MLGADRDGYDIVSLLADAFNVGQSGARHHKAAVLPLAVLQRLAALGQTVAVHGDQRQLAAVLFKERAGVDRAHVAGGDGKDGLVDHAAQRLLRQAQGVETLHARYFRIFLRVHAHEGELAAAALDVDAVAVVDAEAHKAVRQLADHLAQKTGADNDGARLRDVRRDRGIDALLQVIAGDFQTVLRLQQQTLQRLDRAFGGSRAGGRGDGGLQKVLFTGKLHIDSSILKKLFSVYE